MKVTPIIITITNSTLIIKISIILVYINKIVFTCDILFIKTNCYTINHTFTIVIASNFSSYFKFHCSLLY